MLSECIFIQDVGPLVKREAQQKQTTCLPLNYATRMNSKYQCGLFLNGQVNHLNPIKHLYEDLNVKLVASNCLNTNDL